MASRLIRPAWMAASPRALFSQQARSFQTSPRMLEGVAPVRRPVGAFRGTIFGFLLGSVVAGYGMYYYVVDEYKVSNSLLTEDIYALQAAVTRLDGHVKSLEEGFGQSKK